MNTSARPAHVVVVGGGAVGLAAALSLASQDVDVTVVEAGAVGGETSWGNGGWLSPVLTTPAPAAPGMPLVAIRETLQRDKAVTLHLSHMTGHPSWIARLLWNCRGKAYEQNCAYLSALSGSMWESFDELRDDGAEFEMHSKGNLRACLSAAAATKQLEELSPMRRAGFNVPERVLTKEEIHELEPALSPSVSSGFFLPHERHVNPGSFTTALATLLRERGVTVRTDTRVQRMEQAGGRVCSVVTDADPIRTDAVVVAAGMWARQLVAPLGVRLPMRAGKGYSFFVDLPTLPNSPIYMSDSKVGLSPIGGRTRIAGGMEVGRDDLSLNTRLVAGMLKTASTYLTDMPRGAEAQAAIDGAWVGMRPLTPDGLPIIDRVGPVENMYVSTGHGMTGVGLSLVSGKHLAEFVKSGVKPAVLAPFGLARFHGRGYR